MWASGYSWDIIRVFDVFRGAGRVTMKDHSYYRNFERKINQDKTNQLLRAHFYDRRCTLYMNLKVQIIVGCITWYERKWVTSPFNRVHLYIVPSSTHPHLLPFSCCLRHGETMAASLDQGNAKVLTWFPSGATRIYSLGPPPVIKSVPCDVSVLGLSDNNWVVDISALLLD